VRDEAPGLQPRLEGRKARFLAVHDFLPRSLYVIARDLYSG
jgi:hypothetical protein